MKKSRLVLMIAFLMLTLSLGILAPAADARAAQLKNVLKAPKTAGQWVIAKKGYRYRCASNGKYAKNAWLNIEGNIYYFKSDGYLQTGWKKYNGRRYYFDAQGVLYHSGWKKISGAKYYLSASTGGAYQGKKKIGGSWYYFDKTTGKMLTGWRKIGDAYYYFQKSSGKMAVNQKVGKYYVDGQGRRVASNPLTTPQETVQETKVIFVGDSRTLGMAETVPGITAIAKTGQGYWWFISEALPQLQAQLKKTPKASVVFNFGVNDITNYTQYIAKYQELIKKYPKAKFYVMSVNPIKKKLYNAYGYYGGYAKMNKLIKTFNAEMKKAFPDQYIDAFTYLKKNGFSTVDGLHYDSETYRKIYDYVIAAING